MQSWTGNIFRILQKFTQHKLVLLIEQLLICQRAGVWRRGGISNAWVHHHWAHGIDPIHSLLQEQNKRDSPNYSVPLSTVARVCNYSFWHYTHFMFTKSRSAQLQLRLPCSFVSWEFLAFCLQFQPGRYWCVTQGGYLLWDFYGALILKYCPLH